MIQINLLPQENYAKASKRASSGPNQGAVIVTAVLLLAFIVVLGLGGYFYYSLLSIQTEASRQVAQAATLKSERDTKRDQFRDISAQLDALRSQVALLSALDPQEGRLFWAEKLNLLPQVVPEGVFLTRINVTEDVKQKETKESQEAYEKWRKMPVKSRPQAPPKKEFYPEITYRLTLDGIAYVQDGADEQLVELAVRFHNRIKTETLVVPHSGEETGFMDNFRNTIGISPMSRTSIDNRPVYKFSFTLDTIPNKIDTSKEVI
ncbi:MAG: PilN domain-containing protein [Sumerlaeia bacterium]